MPDYISAPDAEFDAWQQNFVSSANANLAAVGLAAADGQELHVESGGTGARANSDYSVGGGMSEPFR